MELAFPPPPCGARFSYRALYRALFEGATRMRHRQEAVLFPRLYALKDGNRVVVWWYYVTTPTGQRVRFILATHSKTKARYLLDQKIKSGEFIPVKQPVLRLQEFAEAFWVWDRCNYIIKRSSRV
jgi:hypothetical protein